jgi:hypothetical protein
MKRGYLAICLLFIAAGVFAQMTPMPKPELYLIHEEVARPSMLSQYESVTRDFLNAFTEKKADPKVWGMNLYMTNDMHYIYVIPISNWAVMDAMPQNWASMSQAIGKDRWRDLMTRGNSAIYSYDETVAVRRPDLSYVPANPRLKQDEQKFVHLMFYYIDAAKTDEAEQVAKDYAALFKAKNITEPFTVFQALSGTDLPLYVVSVPAKSASDYYATDDRVNATLGADIRPLQARAMSVARKLDYRDATYRPDLSYPLPASMTASK